MDTLGPLLGGVWTAAQPNLWWIVPLLVVAAVYSFPMPGRGPLSSRRDVWRGFRFGARAQVFARAGDRCEGAVLFVWGRCGKIAAEVDHVFPHSKGGPTVVSNGQALCATHNRSKGSRPPQWWYVLALEKRRREYFPEGVDVRVRAVMNAGDVEARRLWELRQRR